MLNIFFALMLFVLAIIPMFVSVGGLATAYIGAATAIILAGIGSSVGVGIAGEAAAGIVAEDPDKFGRVLLLQALPGTQGVYGFIAGFLALNQIQALGTMMTIDQGRAFLFACLPVAVTCLLSGAYQGRVSVACMQIVAKKPEDSGKALILPALVEFYAVLGLLGTILLLQGIV